MGLVMWLSSECLYAVTNLNNYLSFFPYSSKIVCVCLQKMQAQ